MRNFAIVTDSASDLPAEYFQEHDIACVDLGFNLDGVIYGGESGNKMDVKVFYDKLRQGAMPTTFQVTPEQARSAIEPLLKAGQDVLALAFSSGLSGTANSFVIAARDLTEEYPERHVEVVDSLCASMGEGLFVDYVVKKADEGVSLKEARDYAENLKQHICHFFTVDNLFHLKRGGRVSAATAVVGSIGFLGLIVPHIARLIVGNDHKKLIPYSALLGALFFLVADTVGRWIAYPYEIGVNIIMSIVGGPLFIILLLRSKKYA